MQDGYASCDTLGDTEIVEEQTSNGQRLLFLAALKDIFGDSPPPAEAEAEEDYSDLDNQLEGLEATENSEAVRDRGESPAKVDLKLHVSQEMSSLRESQMEGSLL